MTPAPQFVRRFARLPAILSLLERHPDGLSIPQVALAMDAPVDEVREDLLAFYTADVTPDQLFGLTRREIIDFLSPAGEVVDPNEAEVVRLTDPRPTEELGVEYVDAADLALLYTSARDLQALEPDDPDLAGAVEVLRGALLGPQRHTSTTGDRTADELARTLQEATRAHQRVEITYSRAWRLGVSTRVIEPYRLLRTRRGWEVDAGPLHEDGSIRSFLLSNVRSATVLDETFEVPLGADEAVRLNRATQTVRVRLPQRARWVADRFAEGVVVVDDDEDVVTLDLALLPPLQHRLGLLLVVAGPEASAVSPPELTQAGAEVAAELLAHHRGGR